MSEEIKTKTCSKCGQDLPLEMFFMGPNLNHRAMCKDCTRDCANERKKAPMPWYEDWILRD